jgi:predicted Fe-Mo cluster-binding NifX family protein
LLIQVRIAFLLLSQITDGARRPTLAFPFAALFKDRVLAPWLQDSGAMRIAIPVWNDRISPVFDVAGAIRLIDIADGVVVNSSTREFENKNRAATLVMLGVDLLICAAISIPLESTLWVSGVEVIPDICGSLEEISQALASGDRDLTRFRSPGNTRRHRSLARILLRQRTGARASR